MKRARQVSTQKIQKEQMFLVKLERELNNVLSKINENLNTLKVEELQLRSQAVYNFSNEDEPEEATEIKYAKDVIASIEKQPTFDDNPEVVNQQEIDLDVYMRNFNEEEDE